ncbi:TM0106 family RecB-like putative nuclease [Mesorhizobium sp. CAU 1732]|uniref:TM0106 family RecB-like putative nuclease n=1 Tax=Mesorhizobium sp. CAU 1732 TaxID=3140358 RepID=UPI0032604BA2
MRLSGAKEIVLSPTDLMRFQGCEHATALDLALVRGDAISPAEESEDALLLQKKGHEHEAAYLASLKAAGRRIATIESDGHGFDEAAAATVAAMRDGFDVIYQGALRTGRWQGYSDFLERVEKPSALGHFSYEAVDTKLKRRADPKHALQLSIYSKAISEVQVALPRSAHVQLGNGERASFLVEDAVYYASRLASRLEEFVEAPWTTVAEPVSACGLCRWREHCDANWTEADSLVKVAGMTRQQRRKLAGAGISTMRAFADSELPIPGIQETVLWRLRNQARLQSARCDGGTPSFILRSMESGRGLLRLPRPANGDLFFDMEGDPLVDGGREYLFGVYRETDGRSEFRTWWAHDEQQERIATEDVLAFFTSHLARHPEAYVYHYNHYEVTALKRLATNYGVAEHHLDHLLRTGKFVDLYRVVQQGLVASEAGYSIKDLEAFYMEKRDGEVATAGASIVAYEQWLDTGDQKLLDEIAAYNEVDCRSTKGLRDWLVEKVRPSELPWFVPTAPETSAPVEEPERIALRDRIEALRLQIGDRLADLVFELNGFHKRADKPGWWEYFDRQDRETAELIDDLESIGRLSAIRPASGQERRYRYPPQQTKMREGSGAAMRGMKGKATIVELDRTAREITVKFPKAIVPPDSVDLVPEQPLDAKVLRAAVARVTDGLIAAGFKGSAFADFLRREPPRIRDVRSGDPLIPGRERVIETVAAIRNLEGGCLPIQGPPGTGKTYVSSKAIFDLVQKGRRVAVMSHSHKAINNLLVEVAKRAREAGSRIQIAKKISKPEDAPDDPTIISTSKNEDAVLMTASVVGGTAWLFARPDLIGTFSHVFVDEAGQVSIANLMAASGCASNIVLVGDQMQLPQPIQGVHPGETALSTLEYLLGGDHAVAADRGIFLPVSRRMHPDVCSLVSRLAYDGRLESDEDASRQAIRFAGGGLPATGVAFIDIAHEGNSQESIEEADAVCAAFERLLGASFVDREGVERKMTIDDILVVSPYNAQVNLLTSKLPDGARIGTVDRFQGQEAPACLISFATSSGAEMPRSIDFLFSLNRLNVAISRAQALAMLFCSPRLLDVQCSTLEEMRLVNSLCMVRDRADRRAVG